MKVGQKLKLLRERRKLSQRELAKRSGIANATISMVERDQISPSVSSLTLLLNALGVSLQHFFSPDSEREEQVVFRQAELQIERRQGIIRRQVAATADSHALCLRHESYHPGADTGSLPMRKAVELSGMVVSGEIELTVADRSYALGAGDAYHLHPQIPYRLRNQSMVLCEIVTACTPPAD